MANTGYKITTYKDKNIYSPTYNTTKEEKEYDEDLCPTRNYYTSISFDINTESSTDNYPSNYFKIDMEYFGVSPTAEETISLLERAKLIFESEKIDTDTKDKLYQDLMKID